MTEPFRQPVEKRIQDITTYGVLLLIMSILSGTFKILMFTIPVFLILAAVLATGRYKQGKFCAQRQSAFLEEQRKNRVLAGCKNIYNRERIHGY